MSWINHLPPSCWSTCWKSTFKQHLRCRFDIMDSISSLFFYFHICYCICLDTSYPFSALSLLLKWCALSLFLLSTLVLTVSTDVVFILSIRVTISACMSFWHHVFRTLLYLDKCGYETHRYYGIYSLTAKHIIIIKLAILQIDISNLIITLWGRQKPPVTFKQRCNECTVCT